MEIAVYGAWFAVCQHVLILSLVDLHIALRYYSTQCSRSDEFTSANWTVDLPGKTPFNIRENSRLKLKKLDKIVHCTSLKSDLVFKKRDLVAAVGMSRSKPQLFLLLIWFQVAFVL